MRMRKKKNLAPRMETCGALLVTDPAAEKGRWREHKPDAVRLRLELGCGKGRFTAETAAAHPEDLYVAIERVPDAMVIAMERCRDLGLSNVFLSTVTPPRWSGTLPPVRWTSSISISAILGRP